MLNWLKLHHIVHHTTVSALQQLILYSQKMISWALLRAVNSLQL